MAQPMSLVNDDTATYSDSEIWVLFVGNPADLTSNGNPISGQRNLGLPTGAVSTAAAASSATVQSDAYKNLNMPMPAPNYPLQFLSGANAGAQVQVTAFNSNTGTFTVQKDPTVSNGIWPLQAQAAGDQFIIGAYSQQLSTFHKTGTTTSKLSGTSPNVYEVTANDVASGVVFISYEQITYLDAAPSIGAAKFAFQTVELTTGTGGGATTSDLTVIDNFGIPLQIQTLDSGDQVDVRTFYFSKTTIEAGIQAVGATKNTTSGMYLGPGQQAAANGGDPSPFSSFKDYLNSLLHKTLTIEGSQNFGAANPQVVYGVEVAQNYNTTYGYSGAIVPRTGVGNFLMSLTPISGKNTIAPAPGSTNSNLGYFPKPSDIESIMINFPPVNPSDPSFDEIIYGAILNAQSFFVQLKAGAPSLTPTTFSGPFSISTGNSATSFTAAQLSLLDVANLAGFTLEMTSGAANGEQATIASIDGNGVVTLSTALSHTPAQNDTFDILFSVTSGTAGNSTTSFGSTGLSILSFIAPLSITFRSGANSGTQKDVVALTSSGSATLGSALSHAPVAGDLFSVSVNSGDLFTQLYTNSVFSWVVANVLSGLNFGFPGAPKGGSSSSNWFTAFPQEFPFGIARGNPDDGYYNRWAAYFYNASDAYGFAFSDRVEPSPLMSTSPSQTLGITVLPANQIDAPLVTAATNVPAGKDRAVISLSWPAQTGVTYTVTSQPAIPAGQVAINSTKGAAILSGLPLGMPYEIQVKGTKGQQESLILPVYITSAGTLVPTSGSVPFGFSFTWAGTTSLSGGVKLNGTALSLTGTPPHTSSNLAAGGDSGTNLYVLDFENTGFQAVISVDFANVTSTSFDIQGTPQVYGAAGTPVPITAAPAIGPYTITQNASGSTSNLVLNINFKPEERKEFAPVKPISGHSANNVGGSRPTPSGGRLEDH